MKGDNQTFLLNPRYKTANCSDLLSAFTAFTRSCAQFIFHQSSCCFNTPNRIQQYFWLHCHFSLSSIEYIMQKLLVCCTMFGVLFVFETFIGLFYLLLRAYVGVQILKTSRPLFQQFETDWHLVVGWLFWFCFLNYFPTLFPH